MDLTFTFDKQSKIPLYMQLYTFIRNEIIAGRLIENEKLPSIRNLSVYLNLSRTTIENAYNQLVVEGYILNKPQKGYFINKLDLVLLNLEKEKKEESFFDEQRNNFPYDFKSEYVEMDNFDFFMWKKHINFVINYYYKELYSFGHLKGEYPLRKAIQTYIHRTRGVIAPVHGIIIGAGIYPLLNMLTSILKQHGYSELAIETPGFDRVRHIFRDNNFEVLPVAVNEKGMDINQLKNTKAKICYVSPSHQYPTGTVMPIDSRMQLIRWAHEDNGFIIEDDYNSELRYEGKPIPAMKGIDQKDRVIYLGSFSTVLVPAVRISFMILPENLLKTFQGIQNCFSQTASIIEQRALAHMMETGDFERHIRKIRKKYAKKRELTQKLVRKYLGNKVEIVSSDAGLHMLLKIHGNSDEASIIKECKEEGINLSGITEYGALKDEKSTTLVISFRGIKVGIIEEGIKKIAEIIGESSQL